jgi:hypothetical protein
VLRLTPPTINSSYSFSGTRYTYSLTLRSSELSVLNSGSSSMFDALEMLNWGRGSLKLRSGGSRSVIEMLRSIFAVFACFWGTGFYCSFFGCLQSFAKCPGLSQL